MGHRANFVVINNGSARAYYDHWAALGCVHIFATGPNEACKFAENFELTNELMDWAFAEGGYLLDFDQHKAIVFGYLFNKEDFQDSNSDDDENIEASNVGMEPGVLDFLRQIAERWAGWKLQW